MNELIGSFAGKRLAVFGALLLAIALLATGGALSIGTIDAQETPKDSPEQAAAKNAIRMRGQNLGWDRKGLDHIIGGTSVDNLRITLAVGTRHHVCLMNDVGAQQFRADSGNADPANPNADPPTELPAGDTPGDLADIDDWDWTPTLDNRGVPLDDADETDNKLTENGPARVLQTAPRPSTGSTGETTITGWSWVIAKKANTAGTPTVTNPVRTFPNAGTDEVESSSAEACVHWTSTAPGVQVISLYSGTRFAAGGQQLWDERRGDTDGDYDFTVGADAPTGGDANLDGTTPFEGNSDVDDPATQLEVTWLDSDPLIQVTRQVGNFAPTAVSAPIAQRVDFVGGVDAAFTSEGGTEIEVSVAAVQSALQSQALTGASVSFAVTGTCGIVTVPEAIISTTPTLVKDDIRPGQTGTIASWGTGPVTATFKNAGAGGSGSYPKCRMANSSTTLTITSGEATNAVTVNWNWDGYAVFSQENVNDTTKKVTFHSATPRTYNALGQAVGWECNSAGQERSLAVNVDGRATVAAPGAKTGNVTVGAGGIVTPTSVGRATPQRTLGAGDSECQYTWTISSPARAADVYVDITTLGADPFSEVLNFAPAAAPVTTFDDLDDPLDPGIDFIVWTGEDTAVADAIGDSGALAVYYWVSATQSWLSFFPGQEGLGVNTLTTLSNGEIYSVSTPTN